MTCFEFFLKIDCMSQNIKYFKIPKILSFFLNFHFRKLNVEEIFTKNSNSGKTTKFHEKEDKIFLAPKF